MSEEEEGIGPHGATDSWSLIFPAQNRTHFHTFAQVRKRDGQSQPLTQNLFKKTETKDVFTENSAIRDKKLK